MDGPPARQLVDELEDLEYVGDDQDSHNRERLAHHWHHDVAHLLTSRCSVNPARFHDIGWQDLQTSIENRHSEPKRTPDEHE